MVRSGTIKTLGALVAAMTLGTWALIWMETAPARPAVPLPLQATGPNGSAPFLGLLRETEVPIQYIKWRNIVVHDARDGAETVRGCHFLVGENGDVRAAGLWKRQEDGRHVVVPGFSYNGNSVGVCLTPGGGAPTARQLAALVGLVQELQAALQIPRDRVYLHRDLAQTSCPGPEFPADTFRQSLLNSSR
jgi:hypothetical protein